MRTAWLALLFAVACGGSAKKTAEEPPPAEPPPPATELQPAEDEGAAPPVGNTPVAVFDCKSGVKECDELFGKTVMCVKSANGLSDVERAQYIDTMQKTCE